MLIYKIAVNLIKGGGKRVFLLTVTVLVFILLTLSLVYAQDEELEEILEALEADDPNIRIETVDMLSYCGHPKAFELLIKTLKDHDWAVRKEAVRALGDLGDTKAVKYIVELLQDQYWPVKREVIRVLGVLGGKDTVAPLKEMMKDEDELIKEAAKRSLIDVGNKALEKIISKNIKERWDAVKTLAYLGNPQPLPLLREVLKMEQDKRVIEALEEAIKILEEASLKKQTASDDKLPPPSSPADTEQTSTNGGK